MDFLVGGGGAPSVGRANTGQLVLGCIKLQGEIAMERKGSKHYSFKISSLGFPLWWRKSFPSPSGLCLWYLTRVIENNPGQGGLQENHAIKWAVSNFLELHICGKNRYMYSQTQARANLCICQFVYFCRYYSYSVTTLTQKFLFPPYLMACSHF